MWAIPGGLADRVAQLVLEEPASSHLGREQIVLSASHTHNSPGNFSTSPFYTEYASCQTGFDCHLFEFLARQIANTIIQAIQKKGQAAIYRREMALEGISRNRSLEAFLLNPEAEQVLAQRHQIEMGNSNLKTSSDIYKAVDPVLTVLSIESLASQKPIAVAAFFSVHLTTMGPKTEVYTSDLFGVASVLAEQRIGVQYNIDAPVVAIFNGAEGDVSPDWESQDRRNTLRLGEKLAKSIMELIQEKGKREEGRISWQFSLVPLADQTFHDKNGRACRTASKPIVGAPVIGGAEDGRSALYDLGWKEGITRKRTSDQGSKQKALNPWHLPISDTIIDFLTPSIYPPEIAPIGLYKIGDMAFATLPGEFTTVLGRRIKMSLQDRLNGSASVLLLGLSNEYISYFTTPEEYDAQHYEGASTLYGPESGLLIETNLIQLADNISKKSPKQRASNYCYDYGSREEFGLHNIGAEPTRYDDGLANILQDLKTGYPYRNYPYFIWEDDILPTWGQESFAGIALTPCVSIEVKQQDDTWKTLKIQGIEETDKGLDFVTIALSVSENKSKWCAIWMKPVELEQNISIRFCVIGLDGKKRIQNTK